MASDRINARLTAPLAEHVARVFGTQGLYETSSEYIRALIRKDMEEESLAQLRSAMEDGYRDLAEGRVFRSSGSFAEDRERFARWEAQGWK